MNYTEIAMDIATKILMLPGEQNATEFLAKYLEGKFSFALDEKDKAIARLAKKVHALEQDVANWKQFAEEIKTP